MLATELDLDLDIIPNDVIKYLIQYMSFGSLFNFKIISKKYKTIVCNKIEEYKKIQKLEGRFPNIFFNIRQCLNENNESLKTNNIHQQYITTLNLLNYLEQKGYITVSYFIL
jgi:hypothetical protein